MSTLPTDAVEPNTQDGSTIRAIKRRASGVRVEGDPTRNVGSADEAKRSTRRDRDEAVPRRTGMTERRLTPEQPGADEPPRSPDDVKRLDAAAHERQTRGAKEALDRAETAGSRGPSDITDAAASQAERNAVSRRQTETRMEERAEDREAKSEQKRKRKERDRRERETERADESNERVSDKFRTRDGEVPLTASPSTDTQADLESIGVVSSALSILTSLGDLL